ncbi:MAG: radical SAM protein [Candidatus Micrarchaeia archaeon]|jgi:MoaA/NifB/PqqE/SkfB family radical SAM enzyme
MRRLFNLGRNIILSNLNLSKPFMLNFAITYHCNSRCLTCNIWKKKSKNELSLEEIENFARENRFVWIRLTGGEPFLRSDIVEIAKIFEKYSKPYFVSIPTNAILPELSYKKIEEISKLNFRLAITISLDGYKELHDKIRGVEGNYEKAIYLFKKLRELKKKRKNLEVMFGYTISYFNLGAFEKTFKEVKKEIPDITPNDFHVNVFHTSQHYYSNLDLKASYDKKFLDEVKKVIELQKGKFGIIPLIESFYLKKSLDYIKNSKTPIQCKALVSQIFIDPYGNVYPCTIWGKKLGNIRKESLREILQKDETKKIRKIIEEGKCPNCWTPCEAHPSILGNVFKLYEIFNKK